MMTTLKRRREDLVPEQIGMYLLGVVLVGVRTAIYRILFNYYVLNLGYEEGLITVLITASVMAMAVSVLPLSYIVDFVGRRSSLIFSISGTILTLVVMLLFPSRWVFLLLNMSLGMFQALTQVSLGSDDSRYMKLFDRVVYYSLPLAFSVAMSYVSSYLPEWLGLTLSSMNDQTIVTLVFVTVIGGLVFVENQYNHHTRQTTPRRVIARLNVGSISIPLIVDEGDEFEEEFTPFDSVAEQVNFVLQGILLEDEYSGPEILITENLDGDLVIVVEDEGSYLGVGQMPEGDAKTFVQRATDHWVEQNYKE
jgi:hypothetical protein